MKRPSAPKSAASTPASQVDSPPINLEAALKELEGIVGRMEDPTTPLEEAIQYYSRGVELSKACAERLAGLERHILLVQRGEGGQLMTEDFEPEEAGDADPDER